MSGAVGISRVVLPIGVNAVESVNCYVLPDGDRVAIVDCGVWRPDLPDGGLAMLEAGLEGAGYALADVGRIVVTHAHIDHYGLAGRLMELTGAELTMHTMTDLDCKKYRHPDTARARRRDTYADHGVSEDERGDLADHLTRWLPYLHSVVEASRRLRGGEELAIGGDPWQVIHTPGHSLGHVCLWSPARGVLLSGDHLLPGITPPVTFERGFDADRRVVTWRRCGRSRTCGTAGAARPRHPVRRATAGSRPSCVPRSVAWRRSAARSGRSRGPSSSSLTCWLPRPSSRTSASSRSTRHSRMWPTFAGPGSWNDEPGRTGFTSGTRPRTRHWTSLRSPLPHPDPGCRSGRPGWGTVAARRRWPGPGMP